MTLGSLQTHNRYVDFLVAMRLFGFVVVSIGLHLLLLLIHLAPDIDERAPHSGLTITLKPFTNIKTVVVGEAQIHQKNTPPQPSITSSPTNHQKTTVTLSPTTSNNRAMLESAKAQTYTVLPSPVEESSAITTTSSAIVIRNKDSEKTERSTILALLHQTFRKHYEYPKLAARKGWHGEVLLGFTLDAHGTIVNAHIAKSSGYRLLDNAALKSLSKVTSIQVQLNEPLTLDLPVSYGFTGS